MIKRLKKLFLDPLLVKEFRTRLRARTVMIIELVYILAVCGLVLLGFVFTQDLNETPGWELGAGLFKTLIYVQAMLMLFVTPLVSAASISGEKEQKTFDSLWVTPVSARRVVIAKMLASLAFFVVLILVSMPFASASFILGGVAPTEMLIAYGLTTACTFAIGAVGIYWSTRFERSIASIPAAAVCAVLAIVLVPMISDMGMKALATISPKEFLSALYEEADIGFFGKDCPFWVPSAAFLSLIFFYFMTAAGGRMSFPKERRFVLQRTITVVFVACLLTFMAGEVVDVQRIGKSPQAARSVVGGLMAALAVGLLLLAPWIGANMPVWRSELGARRRKSWVARAYSALLTRPWWYMLVLVGLGAGCLLAAMLLLPRFNVSRTSLMMAYLGPVGLGALTWMALSLRLADRKTTKWRFINMSIAYVVMALVNIGPLLLGLIPSVRMMDKPPAWIQYLLLTSPVTGIGYAHDPFDTDKTWSAITGHLGTMGPLLITSALYLVLFLILMLPVYPSATRKMFAKPEQPAEAPR